MNPLPSTMRAVIQTGPGKSSVNEIALPEVVYGSVLVKVNAALLHPNFKNIYHANEPHFRLPYPVIPGSNAVGRVVQTGPDATSLKVGQLVLVNTLISARDDPSLQVVWGVSPGLKPEENHLYTSLALQGVYAEFVLAPLEATSALDETRFLGSPDAGGLGYKIPDLLQLASDTILYAGLRSITLQAGERIIITPATGHYSAAAIDVAMAMGLQVIAASRSASGLGRLKKIHPTIGTVELTGDLVMDSKALASYGVVDAVVDVSPPAATGSNNLAAAISTLRSGGRVSLLGVRYDETLPVPYFAAMMKSLTIKGQFMFNREHQRDIIKLAESGTLKLGEATGHIVVATYDLDQIEEAIEKAVETSGPGSSVVIQP